MIELKHEDIGSVKRAGMLRKNGASYTMIAGGRDVWDREDAAHFAYLEQNGDFTCTVRIESLSMANLYTKAGIMARESLGADSRNLFLDAFGDNGPRRNNNGGCEMQFRNETGGESIAVYPEKAENGAPRFPAAYPDVWLRLTRTGNEFTATFSNDGQNWLVYGRHEIALSGALLVGICVTAHDEEKTCECRFSGFELLSPSLSV